MNQLFTRVCTLGGSCTRVARELSIVWNVCTLGTRLKRCLVEGAPCEAYAVVHKVFAVRWASVSVDSGDEWSGADGLIWLAL